MNNLVSIIMPTYNCGDYIAESIRSVLEQTYPHWELIIIDDCSTDNTKEVVAPFTEDKRVRYVCLEQNSGTAAARSKGLSLVQGDFVAFLDSDDLWVPQKLEKQLGFMEEKNQKGIPCYFTATAYRHVDDRGENLPMVCTPPKKTGYWKMLFLSDPIGNSTALYDRRHYGDQAIPDIRKRNDFALWLQMLRDGSACYGISEQLVRYRIRSDSLSFKKLPLYKYHWHLYRNIEKLPMITSLFALFCWAFVKGTHIGLNRKKVKD